MNSSVPGVGSLSRQLELVSRACVFEVVGGGTILNIKDGVKPRGRASSSDALYIVFFVCLCRCFVFFSLIPVK